MVWMGDSRYKLAGSIVTLVHQLEAAYPDREWQTSDGTGTIGDAAHIAEGASSDHNPWLNNTVRALDVAKTAAGPDCEQLFRMVNKMYGDRDPRVFPYGYAIFNGRVTDWGNPGGFHAQVGDPHLEHCHISVGHTGYDLTTPWPIAGAAVDPLEEIMGWYASKSEFEAAIADRTWKEELTDGKQTQTAAAWLRQSRNLSDPAKVAALVLAKLPDDATGGLTRAQVKAAVESGLRDVFADAGTAP